ncbi:cupredoxin domain-containing protein [Mycolicibacterium sp. XJ1819]
MTTIRKTLAGVCLVAALAACGGESGTATESTTENTTDTTAPATATGTSAEAEAAATITIENMSFGDPITVAPGAQIAVENNDSAEHSVTSQTDGQFDVHVDGGQQGTLIAPTEPGEYAFYCIYHPSMTGTLIVG